MNQNSNDTARRVLRRLAPALALGAAMAAPVHGQGADQGGVQSTGLDRITISVQDTDLADVLQMLSIQTRKNIVTSKSVSATITADLYDVTFYESLDAILRVNGYGYIEEGNFIYVHTLAEIAEIEAAMRKREERVFTLNYLSAVDAHEMISPVLSDDGTSAYRGEVQAGFQPDISSGGEDSYAYSAVLVVSDYPENLDRIAKILADVDTPPQQVLVESTIMQTNIDEANAFGVDFSLISSIDFTDLLNPLSAVDNLLGGSDPDNGFQPSDNNASAIASTPGNTRGPSTLKVGILRDSAAFFIRVLDQVTDTMILARPKIMCLNRQRAEVLVGRRVGFLSTTATETTSTQTVEFLDTGIHLLFRPFISPNGTIRMELQPSVSEAQLRDVTDQSGFNVTIPDELTNELTTNVRIRDGETLVLGGLYRESNVSTRRQVPLLGDVPLLGYAFRGHDDTVDREEIIFLITPTIVHDEALWRMGDEATTYIEDVQIGSRQGLLAFSRSRQTEWQNKEAIEAYEAGDLEKAIHYVNNSLRLAPQQPNMVRFREQILGVKERPYERSMMHRILLRELGDLPDPGMGSAVKPADRTWSVSGLTPSNNMFAEDHPAAAADANGWAVHPENPEALSLAERARVTDHMVHEYFVAAGLEAFSPFAAAGLPTSTPDQAPGSEAAPYGATPAFVEVTEDDRPYDD